MRSGARAVGTWLILRFALAENIAGVKLYIPHKQLLVMALLWTVGIMIARMAINIAALRQPLTGKNVSGGKTCKGNYDFKESHDITAFGTALFCYDIWDI